MKIKPEVLLASKKEINFNKILVTGSDESFIAYVKDFIVEDFKKRNFYIDITNNYNQGLMGNLFSEKKTLFVLSDFPTNKDTQINLDNQSVLVALPNGKKTNTIKSTLINLKDNLVIECYTLNRASKETALKNYIETNNLNLSNDVFWYIVDKFDNNYVFFIKQLQMLDLFNKKIELISDIEEITFVDNKIELNKIFFNILKENKVLTNTFNKSVNTLTDFYIFLNSTKLYIDIIKNSKSKESALNNFPKYLFAEKVKFLEIYTKINKGKLVKIYRSISKIEILIRQNPDLCLVVGLRFFLNLKKLIIS